MATILLIEDNPNQRKLYQMELQEEGYLVAVACNGREGVEMVAKEQPDLEVLDLGMPVMDGIEALGRIMDLNPKQRVILYSAYETYKDNFLTWAADAYLVKSSDVDALKQEVSRVLRKR